MAARWVEPVLVAAALIIAAMMPFHWPRELAAGQFVLAISVIFLAQTLIRDLLLLHNSRQRQKLNDDDQREAQCFCVESGVGMLMVIVGLILFCASLGGSVGLSKPGWLGMLTALMVANYLLRDLVFSWNPWQIYRDPNHLNIVPRLSTPRT